MSQRFAVAMLCAVLAACSPAAKQDDKKSGTAPQSISAGASSKNPAAKYIELAGFRVRERGPGKLEVQFGVVNHSEADLGDLAMDVNLRTTTAKPDDPPLCSFAIKVAALGPEELKQVTATLPSKLRVYELPDWQYLKADFQITEPK
ncbi:MAG: hypothetical protein ACR2NN_12155 [Bryobacteraceae bacterium]